MRRIPAYRPSQVKLAEFRLAAAAASVTFDALPLQFRHLLILGSCRADTAALANVVLTFRFNNDSSAVYYTYNSAGVSNNGLTYGQFNPGIAASGAAADTWSPVELWVHDYANTAKHTHGKGIVGTARHAVLTSIAYSWANLAAVTRVDLLPSSGQFIAGSQLALYGVT